MFTKDDLAKYLMFKNVIDQGDFDIKGRAVTEVAALFSWFKSLEQKIAEDIKKENIKINNSVKETGFKK